MIQIVGKIKFETACNPDNEWEIHGKKTVTVKTTRNKDAIICFKIMALKQLPDEEMFGKRLIRLSRKQNYIQNNTKKNEYGACKSK
jgi:hypothetical protein